MANQDDLKKSATKIIRRLVILTGLAAAAWYFPLTAGAIVINGVMTLVALLFVPKEPLGTFVNPQTPSKGVAKAITAEETLLWESRQHPISLWRWWLGAIFAPAVIVHATRATDLVTWRIATIVSIIGVAALAIRLWLWHVDRICLTNKRILTRTGILLRKNSMMPASKLTDLTVETPRLSTILAGIGFIQAPYATLIAESAGQDQALNKIWYVPEGGDLEHLIVDLT